VDIKFSVFLDTLWLCVPKTGLFNKQAAVIDYIFLRTRQLHIQVVQICDGVISVLSSFHVELINVRLFEA